MATNIWHAPQDAPCVILARGGVQVTTRAVTRPHKADFLLYRFLLRLGALFLFAVAAGAFVSAIPYMHDANQRLQAVAPTAASFDFAQAQVYWTEETKRLAALSDRWPFSIPVLLAEAVSLWTEKQVTQWFAGEPAERGYVIIPPGQAGQLHLLSTSIDARLQALRGGRTAATGHDALRYYAGYPLSKSPGIFVQAEEIRAVLDHLDVPDRVLRGYRIVLLPFVLQDTAGLGSRGQAVLGAAPANRSNPAERAAYTIVHELGHHIHFTYIDGRNPKLWDEYMAVRGIKEWVPSGPVGTDAWSRSVQETFAEDFRLLFGPPAARSLSHGTEYGDPTRDFEQARALRSFLRRVMDS